MDKISFDPGVLDGTERLIYELRSLYKSCGYDKFRMSKFEEYDLYVTNKDYLVSDSVITFTDTNGSLMALKPDVTLSIIKNTKDAPDTVTKLCYNENVYRISNNTGSFKEIMQTGLECLGCIDERCIGEVLTLAARSLLQISPDFILETAQLDVLAAFVDELTLDHDVRNDILKCVNEKNVHSIPRICADNGIDPSLAEDLISLVGIYGTPGKVLPMLKELCAKKNCSEHIESMEKSLDILVSEGLGDKVIIDFSVVSDLKYYNGIIFKGFLKGVPGSVLSGGQYDNLMKRMGRRSRAIGFAVYLDMLEKILLDSEVASC